MRAYQLQTSQLLHVIRAMHREWAAQKVLSLEPVTGDGPPVFTDLTVERQRLVERAQLERDERLEERYDEAKRAAFQAEYDQQEIEFQGYIDKNARAEIQRALNAASQRLAPCMSPGIQNAVRHLNSATQYLYNGVHLIELEVKMKLGEYYALQSAHLRQLQHKANASIAEARDRMHRNIDDFDHHSTKAWNKVRPIMQHGLMSLAVFDSRFTHTMISVTVCPFPQ